MIESGAESSESRADVDRVVVVGDPHFALLARRHALDRIALQ